MSTLMSIINAIIKVSKFLKKVRNGVQNIRKIKEIGKIIRDTVIFYAIALIVVVSLIAGALYSVTAAVSVLFNGMQQTEGTNNPSTQALSSLDNSTFDQIANNSGALFNGDKLKKYIEKENESRNISKQATQKLITNNGYGETTQSSSVDLDLTTYKNKYAVNWQFIASVDLATFRSDDSNDSTVLNNVSTINPEFTWADNVSRDITDYWKEWQVTEDYDDRTGQTTTTYNNESQVPEQYNRQEIPLAIPTKVKTLFGDYNYTINYDQTTKDETYCTPYVTDTKVSYRQEYVGMKDDTSQPIYGNVDYYVFKDEDGNEYSLRKNSSSSDNISGNYIYSHEDSFSDSYVFSGDGIFNYLYIPKSAITDTSMLSKKLTFDRTETRNEFQGYVKVPDYKTITTTTRTYKKTREKIVEDTTSEPMLDFNPQKFITFINQSGLKVDDLYLVRESLLNLPQGNNMLDNIDRIINGDYGDINLNNNNNDSSADLDISGDIPLFLQADARWGNIVYYTSPSGDPRTIAQAGCGITSLAMVVDGLGGDMSKVSQYDKNKDGILTPDEVRDYSVDNHFYDNTGGTVRGIYKSLGELMGLKVEETNDTNKVLESLKDGKAVIASMTPGHFTHGSHILVLTGVDGEGKIKVNDPASQERSNQTWDYGIITSEADDYFICENPNLSSTAGFILRIKNGAQETQKKYGVLSSISMAQAIIESGWGKYAPGHNLFGIKADSSWTGPSEELLTQEYSGGSAYSIMAKFRVYNSWAESIEDHGRFLKNNSRYTEYGMFNATDYIGQAQALQNAGYATSSTYAQELINTINEYGLSKYDK